MLDVTVDNEQIQFIQMMLDLAKEAIPNLNEKGHKIIDSIKLRFKLSNNSCMIIESEEAYFLCVFLNEMIEKRKVNQMGHKISLQIIISINLAFHQYDRKQQQQDRIRREILSQI